MKDKEERKARARVCSVAWFDYYDCKEESFLFFAFLFDWLLDE